MRNGETSPQPFHIGSSVALAIALGTREPRPFQVLGASLRTLPTRFRSLYSAEMKDYFEQRGRERWVSILLAPDGEPAGLTAVSIDTRRPRFAGQGDTVVIDAHRRRGLGRWLKADMWLRMRQDAPFVDAIDTGNAESNDPMLAINVAMGFRPLISWSAWQATTEHLLSRTAR